MGGGWKALVRVVRQGSHADLLSQPGRYRDMWQAQKTVKL